jgi:hypothetical protein
MPHALLSALGVLADEAPRRTGPDFGKASPMGLLVVVLLLLATVFLIWSMNRQLKKVPESFDREHPEPDQAADEGTPGISGEGTSRVDSDQPADPNGPPRESDG